MPLGAERVVRRCIAGGAEPDRVQVRAGEALKRQRGQYIPIVGLLFARCQALIYPSPLIAIYVETWPSKN